jgi:hypothetical protein
MGLIDMLTAGASALGFNGTTPATNPGATSLSKLHADGDQPSYSLNGANFSTVNAAYNEYNDGTPNALPQPSQLDLNGATPSRYLDHLPH